MKDKTLCRRCEILSKRIDELDKIIRHIEDDDSRQAHLRYFMEENNKLKEVLDGTRDMFFYKIEKMIKRTIYLTKNIRRLKEIKVIIKEDYEK